MKNLFGNISPYIYPGLQEKIQMELNIKRINAKKPNIGNCYEMVCEALNFDSERLAKKNKKKEVVKERQLVAYILATEYKFVLKEIGKLLGGLDHSTIIHSRNIIANLLEVNEFDTKNLMKLYLVNKNIIKYRYGIE
jgi:chromosomal replication initiation ATPase DnaA